MDLVSADLAITPDLSGQGVADGPRSDGKGSRNDLGFGHPAEYPVVHVRGALGLVGVSTARPSPVPFADGRIGRRQLAAIEAALVRLGAEGKFRVVLIHHPPVDNRHVFLRGLRDREALVLFTVHQR